MENADQYYNKDGWPPESDRAVFLRLSSETPILEVNGVIWLLLCKMCIEFLKGCKALYTKDSDCI